MTIQRAAAWSAPIVYRWAVMLAVALACAASQAQGRGRGDLPDGQPPSREEIRRRTEEAKKKLQEESRRREAERQVPSRDELRRKLEEAKKRREEEARRREEEARQREEDRQPPSPEESRRSWKDRQPPSRDELRENWEEARRRLQEEIERRREEGRPFSREELRKRLEELRRRWEEWKRQQEEQETEEEEQDEEESEVELLEVDGVSRPYIRLKTFYEGDVAYGWHRSGCYVRSGPDAVSKVNSDTNFGERFYGPFRETPHVRALRSAIGVRVGDNPTPRETWDAARAIMQWFDRNTRADDDEFGQLAPDSWPSVEVIADYFTRHRWLPRSACFSVAHLHFQLFRVCGLPTDCFGVAIARYSLGDSSKPSHVYLGLRVGGRWYYIDPGMSLSAYEQRESVGRDIGEPPGMDYVHPREFVTTADSSFKAIPLLAVIELSPHVGPDVTPLRPAVRRPRRR